MKDEADQGRLLTELQLLLQRIVDMKIYPGDSEGIAAGQDLAAIAAHIGDVCRGLGVYPLFDLVVRGYPGNPEAQQIQQFDPLGRQRWGMHTNRWSREDQVKSHQAHARRCLELLRSEQCLEIMMAEVAEMPSHRVTGGDEVPVSGVTAGTEHNSNDPPHLGITVDAELGDVSRIVDGKTMKVSKMSKTLVRTFLVCLRQGAQPSNHDDFLKALGEEELQSNTLTQRFHKIRVKLSPLRVAVDAKTYCVIEK